MFPTTAFGLAALVALLIPGLIYTSLRERYSAAPRRSPFRETVEVLFASVILIGASLGIFSLVRILLPRLTPDVGMLVRGSDDYFRDHYALVFGWATLLLATACLLAASSVRPMQWWSERDGPEGDNKRVNFVSAWTRAFKFNTEDYCLVRCKLEDGSLVIGFVWNYNPAVEEDGDREIVLSAPLSIEHEGKRVSSSEDVVIINAKRVMWLSVEWVAEREIPLVVEDLDAAAAI